MKEAAWIEWDTNNSPRFYVPIEIAEMVKHVMFNLQSLDFSRGYAAGEFQDRLTSA